MADVKAKADRAHFPEADVSSKTEVEAAVASEFRDRGHPLQRGLRWFRPDAA